MMEGLLTTDSITPLFRSLSQKRKSGVFEVRSSDGDTSSIHFHNGRIVAAARMRESEGETVCDRLVQLKHLRHDDALCLLEGCAGDLPALWKGLVETHGVPEKVLSDARRQYEMETLYRLRRLNGSPYRFRAELNGSDQTRVIDVAPGQFLLDLVELEEADAKFTEEFGSLEFSSRLLVRDRNASENSLSILERRVCDVLSAKRSLREVYEQTLLTEIELRAALEALVSRGTISVESTEENASEDLLPEVDAEASPDLQDSWRSLIENASDMLSDLVEEPAAEAPNTIASAQSTKSGPVKSPNVIPNSALQPAMAIAVEQSFGARVKGLWQRMRISRQTLLEHESVEVVALMITILFLWALALWVPWSIERLLVSLDTFASVSRPSMVEFKD